MTLSATQETFRSELVAAVGGMQNDIRTLTGRMDQVEGQVTTKLQQTINLLDDMTSKYYRQENILQQMQEADKEFDERLRKLEQRGVGSDFDPSGASTTDTGGERRAALILGGWDPENPAADTLREAKQLLQNLSIDLDIGEIFVPGIRRGYALIPVPDRPGENPEDKRKRVQAAISRVRRAPQGSRGGGDQTHGGATTRVDSTVAEPRTQTPRQTGRQSQKVLAQPGGCAGETGSGIWNGEHMDQQRENQLRYHSQTLHGR